MTNKNENSNSNDDHPIPIEEKDLNSPKKRRSNPEESNPPESPSEDLTNESSFVGEETETVDSEEVDPLSGPIQVKIEPVELVPTPVPSLNVSIKLSEEALSKVRKNLTEMEGKKEIKIEKPPEMPSIICEIPLIDLKESKIKNELKLEPVKIEEVVYEIEKVPSISPPKTELIIPTIQKCDTEITPRYTNITPPPLPGSPKPEPLKKAESPVVPPIIYNPYNPTPYGPLLPPSSPYRQASAAQYPPSVLQPPPVNVKTEPLTIREPREINRDLHPDPRSHMTTTSSSSSRDEYQQDEYQLYQPLNIPSLSNRNIETLQKIGGDGDGQKELPSTPSVPPPIIGGQPPIQSLMTTGNLVTIGGGPPGAPGPYGYTPYGHVHSPKGIPHLSQQNEPQNLKVKQESSDHLTTDPLQSLKEVKIPGYNPERERDRDRDRPPSNSKYFLNFQQSSLIILFY